MTVAELQVALADLPGNALVEVIHGVYGPNTELVEYAPAVLVSLQDNCVVITTETERVAVEEEYDFIPRRKYK